MSVPVALPAALAYGIADFAGGLAARRAPVLVVTVIAQAAGLLTLLATVWALPGRPSVAALGLGAAAGVAGATGLLLYLRALAMGPMGVVAPLSAVVGAGLPLVVGLATGERLGPVTIVAIFVALVAIVLATAGTRRDAAASTGLVLGLVAGVGFGLFFAILDVTPDDSGLWPLLGGRVVSVALLAVLVLRHRLPLPTRTPSDATVERRSRSRRERASGGGLIPGQERQLDTGSRRLRGVQSGVPNRILACTERRPRATVQ